MRGGGARDRDDGDGTAAPRRVGRLPGGEGARRAARCTDASQRSCGDGARRAEPVLHRGRPLPALHLRADLRREGAGDGDRGPARDHRPSPGSRLRDRRPHASRRRAPGGGEIPADAGAARARARPRRQRRVRRPLPGDRGALGPAGGDRRVRDAVSRPRADRVRCAHLRDRSRLRRRLDPVLVRAGHACLRRRPAGALLRPGRARTRRLRLHRAAGDARRGAGRGAPDRLRARLAVGCRGDRSRAERSARICTPPPAVRRRRPASGQPAQRPPAHARRRRRHRPARRRDHPQPRQRLLRRRRRPPRRRLARARAPRRRAALELDPLPGARLPFRGDRPTRACATS